jgi:3-isopropylmalate dehydrogenase
VQQAVAADIAERGDAKRSTSAVGDAIVERIGATRVISASEGRAS